MSRYSPELIRLGLSASASFKEDVVRNHGQILGVMHPYYTADDLEPLVDYEDKLNSELTRWVTADKPVIIFESQAAMNQLGEKLPRISGRIYTAATHNDSPDLIDHAESWKFFLQLMKDSYANHFTLAGQLLAFNRLETVLESRMDAEMKYFISKMMKIIAANELDAAQWLKKDRIPRYCVGVLARRLLSSDFDVVFSEAVSPNNIVKETKRGRKII